MTSNTSSIETKRFILTSHQIDDFSDSAAMWADPVVARYTTGYVLTEEEAWAKLLRNIGHWAAMHYGHWVFRDKTTGKFLGEGGLSDYKRDMNPNFGANIPEVSLALASWAHNKGYSLEILQAILHWADQHLAFKKTACLIYPENLPSIRIAQKCGFIESTKTMYKNEVNIIFNRQNQFVST